MIYGYRRVSTAEQAGDRSSLADQERVITGAAMMLGADPPQLFTDEGVSGSVPLQQRPKGRKLLGLLSRGDTLIAAKLDRLFRSASDALVTAEALQKAGIALVLLDCGADPVTGNGAAKLFFSVLAAVAEFERGRMLERLIDGRRGKRARGGHTGGQAPYGYAVRGHGREALLEPVEAEQRTVQAISRARADHPDWSLRRLASELADVGVLARNGKPFSATQLWRIFRATPFAAPAAQPVGPVKSGSRLTGSAV